MFWDKDKNYTKRKASEFNAWRSFLQILVCRYFYGIRLKFVYRIEVQGLENVPKDNRYIVCANHLSTLDPPMLAAVMPRRISVMAKQELFNIPFIRWWLDWLGAFAVNRESLSPSTIKTVMEIKKSNIPNNTVTRKLVDIDRQTGNIYESVVIISRRANQISSAIKQELTRKLADFSSTTDSLEETFENREQIEISRYYERMPKPSLIATEEFLDGKIYFRKTDDNQL